MSRLRAILASYWTAGFALVVMTSLHGRWLAHSSHAGEVGAAYGAGLVALGVLMGSRPYRRAGFAGLVDAALPQDDAGYLVGPIYLDELAEVRAAARPWVVLDVLAERIGAVILIVAGTLLNGWAAPLARRWGLPV